MVYSENDDHTGQITIASDIIHVYSLCSHLSVFARMPGEAHLPSIVDAALHNALSGSLSA
jgi:hypothetical protein